MLYVDVYSTLIPKDEHIEKESAKTFSFHCRRHYKEETELFLLFFKELFEEETQKVSCLEYSIAHTNVGDKRV